MTMSYGYGMTCILPNTLSGSTSLYLLMTFCYIYSGDYDYELWLRYDLYTSKHTRWFYFSILVNEVFFFFTVGTMTMSCGYGMTCILPNTLSGSTSLYRTQGQMLSTGSQ